MNKIKKIFEEGLGETFYKKFLPIFLCLMILTSLARFVFSLNVAHSEEKQKKAFCDPAECLELGLFYQMIGQEDLAIALYEYLLNQGSNPSVAYLLKTAYLNRAFKISPFPLFFDLPIDPDASSLSIQFKEKSPSLQAVPKQQSDEFSKEALGVYPGIEMSRIRRLKEKLDYAFDQLNLKDRMLLRYEGRGHGIRVYTTIALLDSDLPEPSRQGDLIVAMPSFQGFTARGVQMGDSIEVVQEHYGLPTKHQCYRSAEFWIYPSVGIVFQIQDARVRQFFLFLSNTP